MTVELVSPRSQLRERGSAQEQIFQLTRSNRLSSGTQQKTIELQHLIIFLTLSKRLELFRGVMSSQEIRGR